MVNVCIRLPAQQVLEYGLVTLRKYGLAIVRDYGFVVGTLHRQCPVFISRPRRAVAISSLLSGVSNIEPSALPFHVTLQRGAASCHGQVAVLRVTARRGDHIHFLLVAQRVGTLEFGHLFFAEFGPL